MPVWLGLLCLLGSPEAPPPLFYAVISDTQKPDGDPLTDLRWGVHEVAAIAPDLLLVPGDVTNTGTIAQYENVMPVFRQFPGQIIWVAGNHDAVPGQAVYRQRFADYARQPSYTQMVKHGWHILVLDTARFEGKKLAHNGEVDDDQLAWLKAEAAKIPAGAPVIVTCHHPFDLPNDGLVNAADVLATLRDDYLVYTLTGHYHRNQMGRDKQGILHLVTGSLSFSTRKKELGIGYRLITTVGREFWTCWVEQGDPLPLHELATFQAPAVGVAQELPELTAERLAIRLKYRGGPVTLICRQGDTALTLGPFAAVEEPADALLPLSPAVTARVLGGTLRVDGPAGTEMQSVTLYETKAEWRYEVLRAAE